MDPLNDPGNAIGTTIAVPFGVRGVIAWYVQLRVWGILPGLTRGMLRREDFPLTVSQAVRDQEAE
jgi:hypothetical protein